MSSCRPAKLPESQLVTREQAGSPRMYAVASRGTLPGDASAIAHGILPHGWIQQAFLATKNQVTEVSVILSTDGPPPRSMPIGVQIRTLHDRAVSSAERDYNGSTDNADFNVRFKNVHLSASAVYILRVVNYSQKEIFIYTHYLDKDQLVPFHAAACEYNSGDDAGHQIALHDASPAIQVLSGFIKGPSS